MQTSKCRYQRGFTLIEIVITVLVVAILAAIALPAYQDQVRKSRRAEAKSHMLQMTQCMERFNTSNSTYVGGPALCQAPPNNFYNLAYINVTRTTFGIDAVPQAGQANDRCGQLGINQAGAKTSEGTAADQCW